MPSLQQRRLALFAFFFLPGIAMASWVTRTPAIRDRIDASIAEMGLVLLGLSVGSMTGILFSGFAVGRFGTKTVIHAGTWAVATGVALMATGTLTGQAAIVALGLGSFGLGMGFAEIAVNIDGAMVERASGKPLMHALHGCFSFGTVLGALAGFAANALAVPVEAHLAAVVVLIAPSTLYFIRHIPEGTARNDAAQTSEVRGDSVARLQPKAEFLYHRNELLQTLTIAGQRILHLDGNGGIDGAHHQSRLFQGTKIKRQHPLRNTRHKPAQFIEPLRTIHQIGSNQQSPSPAQQTHCFLNRTAGHAILHNGRLSRRQV